MKSQRSHENSIEMGPATLPGLSVLVLELLAVCLRLAPEPQWLALVCRGVYVWPEPVAQGI